VARLMHIFATTTSEQVLEMGKRAAFAETEPGSQSAKQFAVGDI